MIEKKTIRIHNKTDKPDNIILREAKIAAECQEIQDNLPSFLNGYFLFIKRNVLPMTRVAYLRDVRFFCKYLIQETDLTYAKSAKDIKLADFQSIKAVDINIFIDYCSSYRKETEKNTYIFENGRRTLARKKSALSVLFKQLFREEILSINITDGFDPIKVSKPGEREIKALQDDEVMIMLDAVANGEGLTKKEREFWMKTKMRDKAILILFVTYGLRISELQQLNLSSFNFSRGEFKIYRKRGKESIMPINKSAEKVIKDYMFEERPNEDRLDQNDKDALFLSLQGKRLTERQIRELVKKYTSIGMSTSRDGGYSPHKLRATTATSLIARGNSIYDVQALLDHESVTTTQLYAAHKLNVKRDLIKDFEWDDEIDKNHKEK